MLHRPHTKPLISKISHHTQEPRYLGLGTYFGPTRSGDWDRQAEAVGRSLPPYTPDPSTRSSTGALVSRNRCGHPPRHIAGERPPRLGTRFGLRCFQPLSVGAWLLGTPCQTADTPEAPARSSSRTMRPLPSGGQRPRQVEYHLSRDGVNPAHVPL